MTSSLFQTPLRPLTLNLSQKCLVTQLSAVPTSFRARVETSQQLSSQLSSPASAPPAPAPAQLASLALEELAPALPSAGVQSHSRDSSAGPAQQAGNSGGTPPHKPSFWTYLHTRERPMTDGPEGLAHLFRHCKPAGCHIPPVKEMLLRDRYIAITTAFVKVRLEDSLF